MVETVNHQLSPVNYAFPNGFLAPKYLATMEAKKRNDQLQRMLEVMKGDSLGDVVRKFDLLGKKISRQAVAKWKNGGEIDQENLLTFCQAYGVDPAYIRYGTGQKRKLSEAHEAVLALMELQPELFRQSMEYLRFQVQRTAALDGEHIAQYFRMIDKIKDSDPRKK